MNISVIGNELVLTSRPSNLSLKEQAGLAHVRDTRRFFTPLEDIRVDLDTNGLLLGFTNIEFYSGGNVNGSSGSCHSTYISKSDSFTHSCKRMWWHSHQLRLSRVEASLRVPFWHTILCSAHEDQEQELRALRYEMGNYGLNSAIFTQKWDILTHISSQM